MFRAHGSQRAASVAGLLMAMALVGATVAVAKQYSTWGMATRVEGAPPGYEADRPTAVTLRDTLPTPWSSISRWRSTPAPSSVALWEGPGTAVRDAQGNEEQNSLWIVDLDGVRVVVNALFLSRDVRG